MKHSGSSWPGLSSTGFRWGQQIIPTITGRTTTTGTAVDQRIPFTRARRHRKLTGPESPRHRATNPTRSTLRRCRIGGGETRSSRPALCRRRPDRYRRQDPRDGVDSQGHQGSLVRTASFRLGRRRLSRNPRPACDGWSWSSTEFAGSCLVAANKNDGAAAAARRTRYGLASARPCASRIPRPVARFRPLLVGADGGPALLGGCQVRVPPSRPATVGSVDSAQPVRLRSPSDTSDSDRSRHPGPAGSIVCFSPSPPPSSRLPPCSAPYSFLLRLRLASRAVVHLRYQCRHHRIEHPRLCDRAIRSRCSFRCCYSS